MKTIIMPLLAAFLFLFAPGVSAGPGARAVPVQLPDQDFAQPADPFLEMERERLMQDTLMVLSDLIGIMEQVGEMPPETRDRLATLSDRTDFLITRQQDLAMRQRLGMR